MVFGPVVVCQSPLLLDLVFSPECVVQPEVADGLEVVDLAEVVADLEAMEALALGWRQWLCR